ncbi:hypothetical protein TWF281_005005 [Arthrobotrys megalospora]
MMLVKVLFYIALLLNYTQSTFALELEENQKLDIPKGLNKSEKWDTLPGPPFSQSLDPRVDVPHTFFYSGGVVVSCIDSAEIVEGRWKPTLPKGMHPVFLTDWASLQGDDLVLQARTLRAQQSRCVRWCTCDSEGNIIGAPGEGANTPGGRNLCRSDGEGRVPDKCCKCTVTLGQPDPNIEGASVADYQRALDRLPVFVQLNNPNYRWDAAPDGPMTYSNSRPRIREGSVIADDPNIAPYPLSGPDGIVMPWEEGHDPWAEEHDPWEGSSSQGGRRGSGSSDPYGGYHGFYDPYGEGFGGGFGGSILKRGTSREADIGPPNDDVITEA